MNYPFKIQNSVFPMFTNPSLTELTNIHHVEYKEIIERCANNVYEELGKDHSEQTYQNALEIEFQEIGLRYERQPTLPILYKGRHVGYHRPDLIVEQKVIIELKVCKSDSATTDSRWTEQLERYLKSLPSHYDPHTCGCLIVFGLKNNTSVRWILPPTHLQSLYQSQTSSINSPTFNLPNPVKESQPMKQDISSLSDKWLEQLLPIDMVATTPFVYIHP